MTVQEFNSTVVDMVNDLVSAVGGEDSELSTFVKLANSVFRLDPGNTMLLDTVYPVLKANESLISQRDEETALRVLKTVVPEAYSSIVDSTWGSLNEANRAILWDYLDVVTKQAFEVKDVQPTKSTQVGKLKSKGKGKGKSATKMSKGLPEDAELFVVYNNIWKEFFQQLHSVDTENSSVWKDLAESPLLNSESCASTFHGSFYKLLKTSSPDCTVKTPQDVMALISPKDEAVMLSELETDLTLLSNDVLFTGSAVTVGYILEAVKRLYSQSPELLTYWSYIKVTTFIFGDCPPELAQLICSVTSGITSLVQG